ncbi:MAG TPA: peptide deformylase [Mycobacteriales bacterium]|nr:peptide deformylase [Mycobacteriales bacterium]
MNLSDEDVRRLPDPVLARRCVDVDPLDADVVALADAMVELMRVSPHCVGIAAPQVGRPWRLFVLDTTGHKKARSAHGLVVMVNPVIVERTGEDIAREGCLSVPDLTGDVPRASGVVVSGVEPRTARTRVIEADAFEARAFQHEIDHVNGLLFLDRVRTPQGLHRRKTYG